MTAASLMVDLTSDEDFLVVARAVSAFDDVVAPFFVDTAFLAASLIAAPSRWVRRGGGTHLVKDFLDAAMDNVGD